MSETVPINEFNTSLTQLLKGIKHIFLSQTIETDTWMQLYTFVYNCCIINPSVEWKLYAIATGRQKYLLTAGIDDRDRRCGGELYYNIENYLIDYVKNLYQMIGSMSGEDLLRFYIDKWDKYQYSSKMLSCISFYLHQHWIPFARTRGYTSIYILSTLSMLIWQEFLLKPLRDRLVNTCLNIIETERNNEVINTQLMKGVLQSYITFNFGEDMPVWFYDQPTTITPLNVYKEFFEKPFLENTEQFYRIEASKHLADEPLIEYLTKIARRLNEEEHRIHSYLQLSLEKSLLELVENILIRDHLNDVCHEVKNMLIKESNEDLKRLFETIRQMPITKNKLKTIVKDHIYQIGHQAIEQVNDPKIYVKAIIEIYEKFFKFTEEVFLNDSTFVDAFNQACTKFINTDLVTDDNGVSKKSSELLAYYCNKLLRDNKQILQESEFEKHLNDITIVFSYIEDKDAFELFYRKLLLKRIVNQQTIFDDYEEMMISKFKQICGLTYTSKLEKILQNVKLSKDLMDQYETYCINKKMTYTFHFSGMVFSSNSWLLSTTNGCTLPEKLQLVLTHFTTFYTSEHNNRQLKFISQYSTGELKTCFTKSKYILQVSTYQMVVLLLFNESIQLTVEQIQTKTQLKFELLCQTLQNLLKFKILICDEELDNIRIDSILRISEDFQNKKIRINLNTAIKSLEQKDIEGTHRTIDEDRKIIIQATIIRIMKGRQILKHSLLMQEVIQQLTSRFKPKIPVIKTCIDILIEKEYLERQANEIDILHYLA